MKRCYGLQIILPAIVVVFGCNPSYITEYHTHLLNSDPKSLEFKDSLFAFDFYPVPNGLYYNITNLSNIPAILEWDRCYFIEPSGNSSRALNVDGGIREDTHMQEGARNESVIPPHGSFGRFTTSALNVRAITVWKSYYYFYKSYGNSSTTLNTFYHYGQYWPDYKGPTFASADSLHKNDIALPNISSYVRKNNNLAIGFCIRLKDTTVDYKFDFKIDKIAIYKAHDTISLELLYSTSDSSDWKWEEAPLAVPVLKAPLNGAIIDSLPAILQWRKPSDATTCSVQVSADSLFQFFVSVDTAKILSSKVLNRLKDNCTYYWRVSANFKDGKSAWTTPSIFTTNFKRKSRANAL